MINELRQVIIGTAGHIDHGKTALVKALTGVDADTLAEEKRRGITIELGFVFMGTVADYDRQIVFIDVPGHERLIKTMVAGASNLDAVMLVIAADEGVAAQTREHFEILRLLGIERGLIALTKVDLVDEEWLAAMTQEIRSYVAGSFLQDAPICPVSAITGAGTEDLRQELQSLAKQATPRADSGLFRMPIDRVFTMQGFGTVVAGTVLSGEVEVGETVAIYPEGLTSRVRGIQIHSVKATKSRLGQRTAINLPDLKKDELRRGQTAAAEGSLTPTHRLDAQLRLLPEADELKHRTRLRLHLGTDEIIVRVTLLDRERLAPGETAPVQFALEAPAVAVPQDRFVVRTFSPLRTIGGGVILDANPDRHKRFDESTMSGLSRLDGGFQEVLSQQLLKSGTTPQTAAEVATALGRSEDEVGQALEELAQAGHAVALPTRQGAPAYLHTDTHNTLRRDFAALLQAYFDRNPYRLWMPLSDLRAQANKLAPKPVVETILSELEDDEVIERRDLRARLVEREIDLSEAERDLARRAEALFYNAKYATPTEDEAREQLQTTPAAFAGVMTALVEKEILVRLTDKVTLHYKHLEAAREVVRTEITRRGQLSVAELRDTMGISRKYTLAIVEYFDATGFTRREGDTRVLA
ncbi:MAG: selenocysteine-specific translation elongation factor [Armatimonadota bacterium]